MDCVFQALSEHLVQIGEEPTRADRFAYDLVKLVTHGPTRQYTRGAYVPFIAAVMARMHKLNVEVQFVWPYEPRLYARHEPWWFRWMVPAKGQVVAKATLRPAVYCSVDGQHAFYASNVPLRGWPIMAVQFKEDGHGR